jgi:hypothetical protein
VSLKDFAVQRSDQETIEHAAESPGDFSSLVPYSNVLSDSSAIIENAVITSRTTNLRQLIETGQSPRLGKRCHKDILE